MGRGNLLGFWASRSRSSFSRADLALSGQEQEHARYSGRRVRRLGSTGPSVATERYEGCGLCRTPIVDLFALAPRRTVSC